ncbi:MAG: DNA primase [Chloroflexi bacterium]|nr:DNA primase [Chloroflexota bacterium]
MSVTDEIKSRIDLVSYVQRHVPGLKKAGRNHKACCPFHNEKTPSFIVNPERQTWHCFGACSEGGDLFTFAQKIHGWDFKEALRELAAEAGIALRAQTPEQKSASDRRDALRGMVNAAADLYQDRLQAGDALAVRRYLTESRGLKDETVRIFQLGYAPDSWDWLLLSLRRLGYSDEDIVEVGLAVRSDKGRVYDRFRNRLMIPIRDERGRVVGFGGRALGQDDSAKYINSPQSALFDKSGLLFGLDMGKGAIRDSGTAVIVEGYLDVIQAHQAGYLNVVAQMGTAMTERQIGLVAPRFAGKIVMALDADEAGQNAARRSLEVARQSLSRDFAGRLSVDLRILQAPAGKDPDDFLRQSPAAWDALVAGAQAVADYVIDAETAALPDNSSMHEREAVALRVLPILTASESNLYQQENVQKLSRRLRISERDLLAWARDKHPAEHSAPPPPMEDLPPAYWQDNQIPYPGEASELSPFSVDAEPAPAIGSGLKRALEPYCLGLLLRDPNLLYLVNRKLRELAGDDDDLLRGPLCALGVDDFTQSQYRMLMAHLQESMAQDDREPLEHLESMVDADLQLEYQALLLEAPEEVSRSIRRNFQVDLNDIFRRRPSRTGPRSSERDELISRALQLRLTRLEYERVELQYLQEEAQSSVEVDQQQTEQLNAKIMLSMKAKARINRAVSRYSHSLQQSSIS